MRGWSAAVCALTIPEHKPRRRSQKPAVAGAAAYGSLHRVFDGRLVPLSEVVDDATAAEGLAAFERETMLGRLPSLADAGSAAVFLASDHARAVTAGAVNLTSGAVAD